MSRDPLVISPEIKVSEALAKMRERDVWSPVIAKEGHLMGFLTERDILTNLIATGTSPGLVNVEDVMSRRYGIVSPQDTLADAASAMMKAKARLVVMDGERLVGVVTAADIVRSYALTARTSPPLKSYATWEVLKVHAQASVKESARIMKAERVGSLLIEESGSVKGIFTERDAVKRFLLEGGDPCDPVSKYATMELITLDANASLLDAAKLMAGKRIKRVPLTQGGSIVGIITARDVVEAIWLMTTKEELVP